MTKKRKKKTMMIDPVPKQSFAPFAPQLDSLGVIPAPKKGEILTLNLTSDIRIGHADESVYLDRLNIQTNGYRVFISGTLGLDSSDKSGTSVPEDTIVEDKEGDEED